MVSEAYPGLVQAPAGSWSDYAQATESPVVPGELGPNHPPPPHVHVDSAGNLINQEMVPGGVAAMGDGVTRRHWAEGVPQQHAEPWYQSKPLTFSIAANAVAGTALTSTLAGGSVTRQELRFRAKSLRVDNLTPYTLVERESLTLIPPNTAGFPVCLDEAIAALELVVAPGSASATAAQTVYVRASERPIPPAPVAVGPAAAGVGTALAGALAAQPVGGTPFVATSAANAAVTLTVPAVAGQRNYLVYLGVSCTPVSSATITLTIQTQGVTWTFSFPSGALGSTAFPVFELETAQPLASAVNQSIVIQATAGGVGVAVTLNALVVTG